MKQIICETDSARQTVDSFEQFDSFDSPSYVGFQFCKFTL